MAEIIVETVSQEAVWASQRTDITTSHTRRFVVSKKTTKSHFDQRFKQAYFERLIALSFRKTFGKRFVSLHSYQPLEATSVLWMNSRHLLMYAFVELC